MAQQMEGMRNIKCAALRCTHMAACCANKAGGAAARGRRFRRLRLPAQTPKRPAFLWETDTMPASLYCARWRGVWSAIRHIMKKRPDDEFVAKRAAGIILLPVGIYERHRSSTESSTPAFRRNSADWDLPMTRRRGRCQCRRSATVT